MPARCFSAVGRITTVKSLNVRSYLDASPTSINLPPAAVLYTAKYCPTQSDHAPVPVMLKEFLPGNERAGLTELQTLHSLRALPAERDFWDAASRGVEDDCIVPALGWFRARPSHAVAGHASLQSLWVAYKWEALQPIAVYPSVHELALKSPLKSHLHLRFMRLRAIMRGVLRAVDKCHRHGIVRRSLSTSSIMVNTLDDMAADRLVVKLTDFGSARIIHRGGGGQLDATGAMTLERRLDCQLLFAAFLEIIMRSLSSNSVPSSQPAASFFAIMLSNAAYSDWALFRRWLEVDANHAVVVKFLNDGDGAGWELLKDVLGGQYDCGTLLQSTFLNA